LEFVFDLSLVSPGLGNRYGFEG